MDRLHFIHRWLDDEVHLHARFPGPFALGRLFLPPVSPSPPRQVMTSWGYQMWDDSGHPLGLSAGASGVGGGTAGSTPGGVGGLVGSGGGGGGAHARHETSAAEGGWHVRGQEGGRLKAARDKVRAPGRSQFARLPTLLMDMCACGARRARRHPPPRCSAQLEREQLAAMGMPALLSSIGSSGSAPGAGAEQPNYDPGADLTVSALAASAAGVPEGGVDKDQRLCDGSDGPLKRRDRKRCARRRQREAALAEMSQRVAVDFVASSGVVPKGDSAAGALGAFVEEAAVSAAKKAGHRPG